MHSAVRSLEGKLPGDSRLLRLERLWMRHFSVYEHTRDAEARREAYDRLQAIERDMAITPADSHRGLAAKVRCCLGREEQEVEPRPWAPLLRSLLSDLEG